MYIYVIFFFYLITTFNLSFDYFFRECFVKELRLIIMNYWFICLNDNLSLISLSTKWRLQMCFFVQTFPFEKHFIQSNKLSFIKLKLYLSKYKIKFKENSKNKRCSTPIKSYSVFSPVDALDPPAQVLTDVHGERVIVQLVHLLQVLTVEHLELAPLRHLLGRLSSFMTLSLSTLGF